MNTYFQFKAFTVHQERCAMKVSTDSCLFGAWVAMKADGVAQALDIGAGTGLLSLMLAQASAAKIDAIEIERECYAQMVSNVEASPWAGRIRCLWGDVRDHPVDSSYDLIISNPPFYEKQLSSPRSSVNTARHSTLLTLEELLASVVTRLAADGRFAVLLPYYRHDELMDLARQVNLFPQDICLARHSARHPWYRTMVIFGKQDRQVTESSIDIRDESGTYSKPFSQLMTNYYR